MVGLAMVIGALMLGVPHPDGRSALVVKKSATPSLAPKTNEAKAGGGRAQHQGQAARGSASHRPGERAQKEEAQEEEVDTNDGKDCYLSCNKTAGACDSFCGKPNLSSGLCCRRGATGSKSVPECAGKGCNDKHCCVSVPWDTEAHAGTTKLWDVDKTPDNKLNPKNKFPKPEWSAGDLAERGGPAEPEGASTDLGQGWDMLKMMQSRVHAAPISASRNRQHELEGHEVDKLKKMQKKLRAQELMMKAHEKLEKARQKNARKQDTGEPKKKLVKKIKAIERMKSHDDRNYKAQTAREAEKEEARDTKERAVAREQAAVLENKAKQLEAALRTAQSEAARQNQKAQLEEAARETQLRLKETQLADAKARLEEAETNRLSLSKEAATLRHEIHQHNSVHGLEASDNVLDSVSDNVSNDTNVTRGALLEERARILEDRVSLDKRTEEFNATRRDVEGNVAWSKCPSSAPAALQGALGGSGQLGTPRVRPRHWGAQPPPRGLERAASKGRSPVSPPLTTDFTAFGHLPLALQARRRLSTTPSSSPRAYRPRSARAPTARSPR